MTASEHSGRRPKGSAGWIYAGDLLGKNIGLIFTDRRGGASPPPFDSLNLAYHTGDEPDNVVRNRAEVAQTLGIPEKRFVYLDQVHGLHVVRAALPDGGSTGEAILAADGVFTTQRGVVLSVLTADCVPIAVGLPAAGIVAMLHAGWRGTVGNIAGCALHGMRMELGLDPGEIHVVMGPAIGPCCYEVDEGRARLFVERYGEKSKVVTGEDGRRLDLLRANLLNLIEAGVREENISGVGGCTCCDDRYYSFRRDGVTGRQGAFVFLQDGG
ncbi:MAG: peptidoglycan editing factor PgeF [Actinobacteria bacterium]|nr:MAG: peptidoglycan editing factor PgeF [Actinomycetota bacterium]